MNTLSVESCSVEGGMAGEGSSIKESSALISLLAVMSPTTP